MLFLFEMLHQIICCIVLGIFNYISTGENGQVSEWSKELVLRSSVAKRVGSNPTLVIIELLLKFLKLRIDSIFMKPVDGHLEQFIYSSIE